MMKLSRPIIVVDDDQDDQEILIEVFKRLGVEKSTKFFSDGPSVMQYLKESAVHPFLILCDINMPVVSGFELREAIISDPVLRKKSVPFVFYSTSATKDQVERAFELTVQGFFSKGARVEEIERRMRIILDYWAESKSPLS
jgi:CheY-like chemotaxis protein